MSVSVVNQVYVFVFMALGGMGAGVFYDVFKLSQRAAGDDKLVINILDFVFWVTLALTLFGYIYLINSAEMRGYEFLGLILGFIFYEVVLSKITVRIILWILELILKILVIIFKIILTPVVFLYKIILYISMPIICCIKFLLKPFKRLFQYIGRKLNIGIKRLGFVFKKV